MYQYWKEYKELCIRGVEFIKRTNSVIWENKSLYYDVLEFVNNVQTNDPEHPVINHFIFMGNKEYVSFYPFEVLRILKNLKRRFSTDDDKPKALVEDIIFDMSLREYPDYDMDIESLKGELYEIAQLGEFGSYSEFQTDSWATINNCIEAGASCILTAPTGAGKSEAFLLPLLYRILQKEERFTLLYPRRELIKDQVGRIAKTLWNSNIHEDIILGIQFGGIGHLTKDLLWNKNMFKVRCTKCNTYLRQNEKKAWVCYYNQGGCSGEKKFLPPWDWYDRFRFNGNKYYKDVNGDLTFNERIENLEVVWEEVLCDICGEPLIAKVSDFFIADGGVEIGADYIKPIQFFCKEHSHRSLKLSLSKEHHIKLKPQIMISNIESLDKLILDPRYSNSSFFNEYSAFILDEVHVYNMLYGEHVFNILQRLKRLKDKISLIGISATINKPKEFGEKLFDDTVKVVDAKTANLQVKSCEYFYFLKSPTESNASAMSTLIQSCMAAVHGILPLNNDGSFGSKAIVFSESLDVVNRGKRQLDDAERNRGLFRFRVQNGIDGKFDCKGKISACPIVGEEICSAYLEGECWRLIHNEILDKPMQIAKISSDDTSERKNLVYSDMIFASPTLEVGVDLSDIGATIHYKNPLTAFNFIQRKGRAARKSEENPVTISVLAGNDPTDAFYFNMTDQLVNGKFTLPLSTNNSIIRGIHEEYLEKYISQEALSMYDSSFYRVRHGDDLKASGWGYVKKRMERCSHWRKFLVLSENFYENYNYYYSQDDIKDARKQLDKRIKKLRDSFVGIKDDPFELIDLVSAQIRKFKNLGIDTSIIAELKEQNDNFKKLLEQEATFEELNNCIKEIAMVAVKIYQDAIDKCDPKDIEMASKFIGTVTEISKYINKGKLWDDLAKLEQLKYYSLALGAIEDIFKIQYKLTSEIIKKYLQGQFFLCWKCDKKCKNFIKLYIPDSYFTTNSTLSVEELGTKKNPYQEADYMLFSNFIPYKLTFRYGNKLSGIKFFVDEINEEEKIYSVSFRLKKNSDLAEFYHQGNKKISFTIPRKIQVETYVTDSNERVKLCLDCGTIYDCSKRDCTCGNTGLKLVKLYSEPDVRRYYNVSNELLDSYRNIDLYRMNTLTVLQGAFVSWREYKGNKQVNHGELEVKYNNQEKLGYSFETRGIIIDIKEYVNKVKANVPVDTDDNVIPHTMAHLFLKAITFITGINEQCFEYSYDSDVIAIWERFTGGVGLVDLFMEEISEFPNKLITALERICDCDCQSNGCPECIWISYCQEGKRNQAKNVSKNIAHLFLNEYKIT